MTNAEVLSKNPIDLAKWLVDNFYVKLPQNLKSEEDIKYAVEMTLKFASYEAYVSQLLTDAEIMTREKKRNGPKNEYEDMIDRKNAVSHMCETVKHQRDALSRSFTIYKYLNDIERL